MSISLYLKQIGRGSKGASDLCRADARTLMHAVLAREVTDLEIGAFCMAMRIKGETADELAGFYDAIAPMMPSLSLDKPVLLLPSYNGARKTHLMTPLLGRWMADLGYLVLIHGTHEDPQRTSSEQLFQALGWTIATAQDNLQTLLQQQQLVYCPLEVICPPLNQLLAVRQIIGVRNSGHILAKLINPVQSQSFQISNYTHPAYPLILEDFFKLHPANVVSMRGHEGEPVASPRRLPELNIRLPQAARAWVTQAEFDETPADYAQGIDAHATATLYAEILSGTCPAPQTLLMQVETLHQAFSNAGTTPADPLEV